jgi:hypothetical protein
MAHSIELLFDPDTEAALRGIWDDLAAASIKPPPGRPHVTVIAARRIDAAVDDLLPAIARRLPLSCAVGAPVLFGQHSFVLTRLIVPSAELLELHAETHRLSGPYLTPLANTVPGQWTAHVTVARRVAGLALDHALRIASTPVQIEGRLAGLRRWDGDERVEYAIS